MRKCLKQSKGTSEGSSKGSKRSRGGGKDRRLLGGIVLFEAVGALLVEIFEGHFAQDSAKRKAAREHLILELFKGILGDRG